MIDPTYLNSVIGSFALLFILGAIEKSRDAERFAGLLENYRLIPALLTGPATVFVITTEAITAVLLVTPAYPWGVITGTSLLLLYAFAIAVNLARGRTHIDCGCLGAGDGGITSGHVWRNLVMALVLVSCLLPVATRDLTSLDYFIVPLFLAGAGMGYIALSMLLALQTNARTWWQS